MAVQDVKITEIDKTVDWAKDKTLQDLIAQTKNQSKYLSNLLRIAGKQEAGNDALVDKLDVLVGITTKASQSAANPNSTSNKNAMTLRDK